MADRGGNRGRIIGDYVLEQQIGSGSFAVVWRSRHIHDGYEVAIKEIATDKLSSKLEQNLLSEITILKQINHPNIIRLHDIVKASGRIYIVLEYCTGGDLAAYIQYHRRSSEAVARHFMRQLAAGLKVLHENNLIHRDLKPQNLLLSTSDRNAVLKIADFGFARTLQPQGLAETLCGSPLYMAPEIMQFQKYNAKADLWSVGAILFQLVTGVPPYSGNSQLQLLQNILKSNELYFPSDIVGGLHPDCIELCRRLLNKNPVERLSFEEFFHHSFMVQARSIGGLENTLTGPGEGPQDDCIPFNLADRHHQSSFFASTKSMSMSSNLTSYTDTNALGRKTVSGKNSSKGKEVYSDIAHTGTNLEASTSNYNFQRSFESELNQESILKVSQAANIGQEHRITSSKGVVDSLESIEQEYVLVNSHGTSTETLSSSLCGSGLDHSQSKIAASVPNIQKSISSPMQIVGAPVCSVSGVESLGSQTSIPSRTSQASIDANDMLDRPCSHPPRMLQSLQRCAHSISDLVNEKLDAGNQIEAFSLQLLCLAIWKKALRVSHSWASSFAGRSSSQDGLPSDGGVHKTGTVNSGDMPREVDFVGPASACSQTEREFVVAVEVAEQLAKHLGLLDGSAQMPDAMEIVFQAALALGRKGAVCELYKDSNNAAAFYLKSTTLLSFILVEASSLELNPKFSLSVSDQKRLHRYINYLTIHQHHSEMQRTPFLPPEDQQSL
ncbi:hypothetical protein SUGI_1189660 [Cryptomeria japonica]|uniref:serine/threonine-protein kinase ATG1c n=1 Tax=Cryptomeria japonica TaxID=3369 RepID=UPI00241472D2|nr:serine/threonine-protein kinase ATG1c [Cryptomeria japonica]GLJ55411.1 hypothetical protein SUGI_1189660 [Cryptomeria japonica]